ncbi:MAG: hypothetical protein HYW33_03855 [Candidatus Blackburnbacteria bacterium]|nr:hypothetical protein [Candidatus Blackburnbacteria bacterium]
MSYVPQKGFAPVIVLLLLAVLVVGGAIAAYFARQYAEKFSEQNLGQGAKVNLPGNGNYSIEYDKFKQSGGTEAKMPNSFPQDIPIYPNGKLTNVSKIAVSNSPTALTFEYEGDVVGEIFTFYKENLEKGEWEFNSGGTAQTSDSGVIFANKQNRELQITVAFKNGKTLLMLSTKG